MQRSIGSYLVQCASSRTVANQSTRFLSPNVYRIKDCLSVAVAARISPSLLARHQRPAISRTTPNSSHASPSCAYLLTPPTLSPNLLMTMHAKRWRYSTKLRKLFTLSATLLPHTSSPLSATKFMRHGNVLKLYLIRKTVFVAFLLASLPLIICSPASTLLISSSSRRGLRSEQPRSRSTLRG